MTGTLARVRFQAYAATPTPPSPRHADSQRSTTPATSGETPVEHVVPQDYQAPGPAYPSVRSLACPIPTYIPSHKVGREAVVRGRHVHEYAHQASCAYPPNLSLRSPQATHPPISPHSVPGGEGEGRRTSSCSTTDSVIHLNFASSASISTATWADACERWFAREQSCSPCWRAFLDWRTRERGCGCVGELDWDGERALAWDEESCEWDWDWEREGAGVLCSWDGGGDDAMVVVVHRMTVRHHASCIMEVPSTPRVIVGNTLLLPASR